MKFVDIFGSNVADNAEYAMIEEFAIMLAMFHKYFYYVYVRGNPGRCSMVIFTKEWFSSRWEETKNRAGKRYTPQLNINLPLSGYFDSACQNDAFFVQFNDFHNVLNKVRHKLHLNEVIEIIPEDQAGRLNGLFDDILGWFSHFLMLKDSRPMRVPIDALITITANTEIILSEIVKCFYARQVNDSRGHQSVAGRQMEVALEFQRKLGEVIYMIKSLNTIVSNEPYILLLGSAGTGKTHLLCEMTHQRIEAGMPALMFLGQAFQKPFSNAVDALVHSVAPTADSESFLANLDEYARAHSTRCLLSVDAINEGHRQSWSRGLPELINTIRRYRGLALVIGCRTPFEQMLVISSDDLHLHTIVHNGFPLDDQIEAINKYFHAYHIPLPEVPLLGKEFANPLFLKLFCEAFERVIDNKHAQIKTIASGQRGMTYILENFVDYKGRVIAERLSVDKNLAWNFLKEKFAPRLADEHTNAILRTDAASLADAMQPSNLKMGAFLRELINEDILAEDLIFDNGMPQEVVRCTYQKFADHLVARHVLVLHLDNSTPETIKESFRNPDRLGAYFINHNAVNRNINLIQALMVEFPTRINNSGELLDYLEWTTLPISLCKEFLSGLYWREARSINQSTCELVNAFLDHDDLKDEALNVLLALSVKPQHPFHAGQLDVFLKHQSLTARDLFWSEFLRKDAGQGTPNRILVWIEHLVPRTPDAKTPASECVKIYITVLKWFLTSTHREFRDRVTHALFRLGQIHPKLLFEETIRSLELNDPYVPQRMLAASYGVTMSLWQCTANADFQGRILPRFARQLYCRMFARNAKFGTTHVLSREYAQGIIHLALLIAPQLLSHGQRRRITSPFILKKICHWREQTDRDEGCYREGDAPLGMDFANYTLGRLIRGRSAYDNNNNEYQRVKRQIYWRIHDLGYTLKAFSAVDREIARHSWSVEQQGSQRNQTDRYGKKYAWIAFYELAGYRLDLGLMDASERLSDADIDPSFPELPNEKIHVFEHPWIDNDGSVRDWILSEYRPRVENKLILSEIRGQNGPWVMIDGFVSRESTDKTIHAFFDTVFVKSEHKAPLISAITLSEYSEKYNIPRPEEEHYTYAGEVPWAHTWRFQQHQNSIEIDGNPIPVFLPVREYSWESYHSNENRIGGLSFPSKELGEELGLYVQAPSITMAERGTGRIATQPIIWGSSYHDHESILYIRQDLLDKYLIKHEFTFLMVVWGERRGNYHLGEIARKMEGSFENCRVVHKQVFIYKYGDFEQLM